MPQAPKKILLTGATGYIGGTVLAAILNSSAPSLKSACITCLLRGSECAAQLTSAYGDRVKPVLYEDLDDLDRAIEVASQHDIALVRGLAQRKQSLGCEVWMIHTSGVSNIGDRPISNPMPIHEWDDIKDDVYTFEKKLEDEYAYPQRTAELGVVDTGLQLGVKTLVIMSPIIYGIGTDLADLYALVAQEIMEGNLESIPSGKKGIIYSSNGQHSWLELTSDLAEVCHKNGLIPEKTITHVDLDEGTALLAPTLGFPDLAIDSSNARAYVETVFASNARTVASVARSLGWKPSRGEEAWKQNFQDDANVLLKAVKKT
ncbi:nad dependent epimerase dehydratase family protein [Botrytis cinerea]